MEEAREVMKMIKTDGFVENPPPPIPMSEWIARTIERNIRTLPFASFFDKDVVLVPVPSSALMQPFSLWVPSRLANALVKTRLGREVIPFLKRETPVNKAAWSKPSERPKVKEHIATMSLQERISEPPPSKILLVDDIVTRGSTLLGAANRLIEAMPTAQIYAFAAMRTISDSTDFENLYKPVVGSIQYRPSTEDTLRRP